MPENQIATIIVDAAYTVHSKLGPGLLESVYEASLAHELAKRGMKVRRQQAREPRHRVDALERTIAWFDRFLK